jgi:hypothetical protein
MVAQLNHTIVAARDKHESATFFSEILGLPKPTTTADEALLRGPERPLPRGTDEALRQRRMD